MEECEGGETERPGASRQAELKVIKTAISPVVIQSDWVRLSDGPARLPST